MNQRRIELLSPAKNLECGLAAIDHGADAVYIGGPSFGARAAAGNSLADIAELVQYAHLFRAKVYVTVNTILKNEELENTRRMIVELYRMGVDALIVQDMALLEMDLPPIPLHSSTQMDNRTVEKVRFEQQVGFQQSVLARELSLKEIRKIHEEVPDIQLEAFIHGALCVSFSGQCYVSQACFGRSANRGECAQFCRLPFNLEDATGKVIVRQKHLLSMRDLNQSECLEDLLDAGVSSLKIEGRLKDVGYVKNVTAFYRLCLDEIFARRKEYVRSSSGTSHLSFQPQLDKSFSRGFTHYFLFGRQENLSEERRVHDNVSSMDTPKSMGEEMGLVKEVKGNYLTVAGVKHFNNGDGACFLDENGSLHGFRVNKVDENKIFPQEMPKIKPRTKLFRNFDQEFEKMLAKPSAERKLGVDLCLYDCQQGFALELTDEDGTMVCVRLEQAKEQARTPQIENLRKQLSKLGNTPFEVRKIEIRLSDNYFIPSSQIAELRRNGIEKLLLARRITYPQERCTLKKSAIPFVTSELTYLGNVMNDKAFTFYERHGVKKIAPAFEKQEPMHVPVMFCKHCIRFSKGWCPIHQKGRSPYQEPYYLVGTDGQRFQLEFDCKHCQMKVIK